MWGAVEAGCAAVCRVVARGGEGHGLNDCQFVPMPVTVTTCLRGESWSCTLLLMLVLLLLLLWLWWWLCR